MLVEGTEGKGLGLEYIIPIVAGGCCLIMAIIVLIVYCKKKKEKGGIDDTEDNEIEQFDEEP